MENKKIKLKSIYNILRDLIMIKGGWAFKKLPKEGVSIEIPSTEFPDTLDIDLEEMQKLLQELEDMRVIKFDGIIREETHCPHESEPSFVATIPILRIWFLKDLDIEEIIRAEIPQNGNVEFLDNDAIIKANEKKCQLPPYKNEHFLCRAVFEHPIDEPVDWSIIYEKMTGYYESYYGKPSAIRKNWHMVYDTMEALNKRVKEVLGIEKLFVWQEKTVKRIL